MLIRARRIVGSLLRRRAFENAMAEEMRFHLDARTDDLVRSGLPIDEARRRARLEFGDVHNTQLDCRESRGLLVVDEMRDDLKAAFRSLTSSKTFTAVALIVLALGIGASTAVFSVVDAVVLRGLPFDESEKLVAVGERRRVTPNVLVDPNRDPLSISSAAPQNYADWAARQQVFQSIAAIAGRAFTLKEQGNEPEELQAQLVTASFFDVLRARPGLGRAFGAESEVDGNHRVVVLSDGLWRRRFGANPDIIGQLIPLEGGSYEVIGIMAADFEYPVGVVRQTDLWTPYVVPADERIRNPKTLSLYLQAIARLKPGVTIEQAQANMDQIAAALIREHPVWNKDTLVGVRPLRDHIVDARTQEWMLLLLGGVGIVLLIACANVANLLLARASVRQREVSIRAAMGAGRWRLVRQLMVESLVLSLIAAGLGILLAWWGVDALKGALPEGLPRVAHVSMDMRVLATAIGMALITGLLFGTVPALQLSRTDLAGTLKSGTHAVAGGRGKRVRSAVVIAEIALAVILLFGAALFIGSFRALMRIDPGFDGDSLLTINIQPRLERNIAAGEKRPDYSPQIMEIVERLEQVPGVLHASAISGGLPLGGALNTTRFAIPGHTLEGSDASISIRTVAPGYYEALNIPLIAGRYFQQSDRMGAPHVIIVNELAARKYFPGGAIGKTVTLFGDRTIVGVVGNVHQSSLEVEPRAEAYVPMLQRPTVFSTLIVKTSGDPYAFLPAVRTALLAVLPDVPVRNVRTIQDVVARATASRRLNALLIGLFGLLGLVISVVGVYGAMAQLVAQRTREIAVRMALGATRRNVASLVLRNALMLIASGLVLGSLGAWFLSVATKAFMFQIDVRDPRAFGAAIGLLAVAALTASATPVRRAVAVDPIIALRTE